MSTTRPCACCIKKSTAIFNTIDFFLQMPNNRPMTKQKLNKSFTEQDKERKKEIQKTWEERFKSLLVHTEMDMKAFCAKYRATYEQISRAKNLKMILSWKIIDRVEDGFKKEGF